MNTGIEFARSKSKMGVEEETSPSSFSILQEKHVNPKMLKCCPTMDLIAVYTMDQQLVVYVRIFPLYSSLSKKDI